MDNRPSKLEGKRAINVFALGKERILLELALKAKELEYGILPSEREGTLPFWNGKRAVLQEGEFSVVGLRAIIRYLDSRYPYPQMFNSDPQIAASQESLFSIIVEAYTSKAAGKEIEKLFPTPLRQPLVGRTSAIDLALCPLVADNKRWGAYVNEIRG